MPQPSGKIKTKYYPVSIEIGSSSLKLLQIIKAQNRYEIANIDYLPLVCDNLQQANSAAIKSNLEKIVQRNKINTKKAAACLAANKINTFAYSFPNMPPQELKAAVGWKMKQDPVAGINFEKLSFDYTVSINPQDKSDNQMRVLVFAALKETMFELIKLFKDVSLEVINIQPKPYAAVNALLWLGKINPQETVLVLCLGASQSAVCVVHSGQICFIKPLAVSGCAITQSIADSCQVDRQKAEQLKVQNGFSQYEPLEKAPAIAASYIAAVSSQIENLAMDVEHTFKYFSHQVTKSKITSFSRVILCGGGAVLKNLDKFLSGRFMAPVEVFDPVSSAADYLGGGSLSDLAKLYSASFAAVLGLAAGGIEW